jgi:hypothetical protein
LNEQASGKERMRIDLEATVEESSKQLNELKLEA